MIKRDYLLNMIEQVIQRLQLLTGVIKLEDWPGAIELLDDTMEQLFGWRSEFANAMSEESLLDLVGGNDGRLDVDGVTLLAVLLKSEADIYAARGEETRAYHRYLRALHLFLAASEAGRPRTLPPGWDHTLSTRNALAAYDLPSGTLLRLYDYLNAHRLWASAEDVLWELAEREDIDPQAWRAEGHRFYEKLLHGDEPLDEDELALDELREGRDEWVARFGPLHQDAGRLREVGQTPPD